MPSINSPSALPTGSRLEEFELLQVLGVGGFGIVYLAFDHALEREVAIKEYMPSSLAGRTQTLHVSVRSSADAETFELGRRSFVNEARLLARFDHASLLKVLRFWEANGTAYMAMPVMRGRTLKALRQAMAAPPDESWVRGLLMPLLGAIEKLHSEGVYHRDIAPDNIQIEPDGRPVLLDFGAARRVISDKSQALTAILKPAYAPIEQYGEAGSVKQGPWTDLYALGATLHHLLLGRPPPPATIRLLHDEASALRVADLPGCSEGFLRTIDWMLAPNPSDRPQSVAALREVLEGRALPPLRRSTLSAVANGEKTVLLGGGPSAVQDDDQVTRVKPPAVVPWGQVKLAAQPLEAPAAAVSGPAPAPLTVAASRGGRGPVWLGSAGLVFLLGVAVVWWLKSPVAVPDAVSPTPRATAAAELPSAPTAAAELPSPPTAAAELPSPPTATAAPTAAQTATQTATPQPPPIATAAPAATRVEPRAAPAELKSEIAAAAARAEPAKPVVGPKPVLKPEPRPALPGSATTLPAGASPAALKVPPAAEPKPPPVTDGSPPAAADPVVSASDANKPTPSSPQATCGARNALRYFVCMERECLRSEFSSHADCRKWRAEAKRE